MTTPTDSERITRLEDGLVDLVLYITDGQPQRAGRSLAAGAQGQALLDLLDAIKAERGAP